MPRQLGQQQFITFVKGLNTEAGPLTFPENSTIEDINCVLTLKGSHKRRYGIKQEIEGKPLNTGFTDILYNDFKDWNLNTYTWKAPGNVGNKTFLVVQVTDNLYFYDISTNQALPLTGTSLNLSLTDLIVDRDMFKNEGCAFSSGKGLLFVCGRGLDPCYVSYDSETNSVSAQRLLLRVRDSVGVDDGLDNNTQPSTLSNEHLYNLINQGWLYQGSSVIQGSDLKAILTNVYVFEHDAGTLPGSNDDRVTFEIFYDSLSMWRGNLYQLRNEFNSLNPTARNHMTVTYVRDPNHYEIATITFKVDDGWQDNMFNHNIYIVTTRKFNNTSSNNIWNSTSTLTKTYVSMVGTFTYYDGTTAQTTPYNTYFSSKGKYPSNAQQWFVGRQEGQQINVNEVANFDFGNKRAPRGRCILDPFHEDRSQIVPNMPVGAEDKTRIVDTAFMGGHVFYLRQNQLLYSQVLEDVSYASKCYTEGDPTSEDGFDVVDTDGGVISITDMGDAVGLYELANGLAVFAKNGIWLVTGLSLDEGFKATGYSVRKISNVECVARQSIVDVQSSPVFWATSGVYVIAQRDYEGYNVQSLSDQTIQSKYVEIPSHNLKNVYGIYNSGAQKVAWFYDNTDEGVSIEKTRKTKAIIFDVRLQAFYELDMDKEYTHPFICGMFNTPYLSFISLEDEIYSFSQYGLEELVYDNDNNLIYVKEPIKNTDLTDVKYLSFEKSTIPAGPYVVVEDDKYYRDPADDRDNGTIRDCAWKSNITGKIVMSLSTDVPTPMVLANWGLAFTGYRSPEHDADGRFAWQQVGFINRYIYTDSETPVAGDIIYSSSSGSVQLDTVDRYIEEPSLYVTYQIRPGYNVDYGPTDAYFEGYEEDTDVVYLTSCNFDDTSFKDWGNVEYISTFTTGANTCGDSFLTKDIVYLITQLSRTEAVGFDGNIHNDSSCMLQMKWDFEDNDYSHKWTTPVQIYRARRLFAPDLDDPHFDDISIRNPVITTKHKVRGDGRALQIKFTSEPGKNFEVLGWNLTVGARS